MNDPILGRRLIPDLTRTCPVLCLLEQAELLYTDAGRRVTAWLAQKGQSVKDWLLSVPETIEYEECRTSTLRERLESGTVFASSAVRTRPQYAVLDRKALGSAKDFATCSKEYRPSRKAGLSAGVLGLWCIHGHSQGFHILKACEGRNDVFSSIYCYFERAPEVIVYDFACSLSSYAMVREPGFFGSTRFLIDELHSKGHSRCSLSSKISTFKRMDPALKVINASAAECGNAGLNRIRKSVAYMRQARAVELIATFMFTWNRLKRRQQPVDADRLVPEIYDRQHQEHQDAEEDDLQLSSSSGASTPEPQ